MTSSDRSKGATDETIATVPRHPPFRSPSLHSRWLHGYLRPALVGLLIIGAAGCSEKRHDPGWLGINVHLGHSDYDGLWESAKTSPRDRVIYFNLLNELQVPRMRDLFMSWARVQPEKDAAYDFSLSDELVRMASDGNIDILALCWGIPRWAAGRADGPSLDPGVPDREHADAFAAFVRAFVERYDNDGRDDMPKLETRIGAYEFMNEMETVPPAEYAWWLKLFYETVKQADPDAVVALGGLRSPGVRTFDRPEGDYHLYFERLLADDHLAGPRFPYFDAVSFHNFPDEYPGRTPFDHAIGYLNQTLADHGLRRELWLTEFGYNSGTTGETRQAENIVKWTIRARAAGVERIYLHCLWDYHRFRDTGVGENMGLVREVPSGQVPPRKPAFRAFTILLDHIRQHPHVERRGEGSYVMTGQKGRPVYVVWAENSYDQSERHPIHGWWNVQTLTGKTSIRQGPEIEFNRAPLFLTRAESPFIQ